MKIVCSKEEFGLLVRSCYSSSLMKNCLDHCMFSAFCNGAGEDKTCVMDAIEDICEIEVSDG